MSGFEDKQELSIHGFKRKLKKKLEVGSVGLGVVKRDMVEEEERKTGPGGFLAQEKDEEVSVGRNSARLVLGRNG